MCGCIQWWSNAEIDRERIIVRESWSHGSKRQSRNGPPLSSSSSSSEKRKEMGKWGNGPPWWRLRRRKELVGGGRWVYLILFLYKLEWGNGCVCIYLSLALSLLLYVSLKGTMWYVSQLPSTLPLVRD